MSPIPIDDPSEYPHRVPVRPGDIVAIVVLSLTTLVGVLRGDAFGYVLATVCLLVVAHIVVGIVRGET